MGIYEALDMLSDEAGKEIEQGRLFKIAQQKRLEDLAWKAKEFQQQQEQINVNKEQVDAFTSLAMSGS